MKSIAVSARSRSALLAVPSSGVLSVACGFSARFPAGLSRLIFFTLLAAVPLLLWDAGRGDWRLAYWMGGAQGFPLIDGFWTREVLHLGVRRALWPFAVLLVLAIAFGRGVFAHLPRGRRLQLILVPLFASGAVALLKSFSLSSCPWDLADFGGQARYASHWLGWFVADGGAGRCFPAGHASTGFAFVGGWFALREHNARLAKVWLLAALGVGLTLGVAQQLRGAHFMSHTLWTAWLCWCVGLAGEVLHQRLRGVSLRRRVAGWGSTVVQLAAKLRLALAQPLPLPSWKVAISISVWIALFGNLALWRRLAELDLLGGNADRALAIGILIMLACAVFALVNVLAWRAAFKPAAMALLLITALASHFSGAYGVLMTPSMMTNMLQTDYHEARDLFSAALLWHVFWLAGLPALLLWSVRIAHPPLRRCLWQQPLFFVGALVLMVVTAWAIFQPFSAAMRNHKDVRYLFNPLAVLYSTVAAAVQDGQQGMQPLQSIADDARITTASGLPDLSRPKLLVLVVGEAARSENFSLNGYARPTNQALENSGVVSLRNAWSCGTSTAESLPCMFSHQPRSEHVKDKSRYEGLLDVLHKAGLAVLWLENQSGCKGVCERVPTVNLCKDGACMDADMLQGLDARLADLEPQRRARGVVLVLHQMGSHGPAYSLRSPPASKQFLPECTTAALAQCSNEHIRNAYDNSIVYTSQFLARTIAWLQNRQAQYDTALMYVSDHGESLGENNLYLHGLPYALAPKEQKHIGWLTWASPTFWPATQKTLACLASRRDEPVSHDHYFHTVLGLVQASTRVYQRELNWFAPCR